MISTFGRALPRQLVMLAQKGRPLPNLNSKTLPHEVGGLISFSFSPPQRALQLEMWCHV